MYSFVFFRHGDNGYVCFVAFSPVHTATGQDGIGHGPTKVNKVQNSGRNGRIPGAACTCCRAQTAKMRPFRPDFSNFVDLCWPILSYPVSVRTRPELFMHLYPPFLVIRVCWARAVPMAAPRLAGYVNLPPLCARAIASANGVGDYSTGNGILGIQTGPGAGSLFVYRGQM